MVPPEEGKLWEDESVGLERAHVGRRGTWETGVSRETYQAGKGSWGQILFEPVIGTKLCKFLDTKKEVSAVGSIPSNDPGYPSVQEICCCP